MIVVENIDMTMLNVRMGQYARELKVSEADVIRTNAARLKMDLIKETPPKDLAKAQRSAEKKVNVSFYCPSGKLFNKKKRRSQRFDTVWLYAHPKALVGVSREDNKNIGMGIPVSRMMSFHIINQKRKGKRWISFGSRGKQHVYKVNKTVVSKSAKNKFTKIVRDSFGKMKAGWAVKFESLRVGSTEFRIARWIKKHVTSGAAKGDVIVNDKASNPSITIINRARGVEGAHSLKAVRAAIKGRAAKIKKDMENQLRGVYKRAGFANAK